MTDSDKTEQRDRPVLDGDDLREALRRFRLIAMSLDSLAAEANKAALDARRALTELELQASDLDD